MPTRVDGDRCIDYAITNNVQVVKLIGFDQAVISDHFTLKFEITPCQNSNHRDRDLRMSCCNMFSFSPTNTHGSTLEVNKTDWALP